MKLGGAISYFITTCDSFDTRKTNILALCYIFTTYKPAYTGATPVTEINTLDQISTEEVNNVYFLYCAV